MTEPGWVRPFGWADPTGRTWLLSPLVECPLTVQRWCHPQDAPRLPALNHTTGPMPSQSLPKQLASQRQELMQFELEQAKMGQRRGVCLAELGVPDEW